MSDRSVLLVEEGGVGGVADYTAELAGALARQGWRIEIATARDHGYPEQPGVRVHRLFPYVRGRGIVGRLIRRARLSRLVNGVTHLAANIPLLQIARRCAVVHVQGGEWPPLGAAQALLVRAARRPLVWTPHNTFDRGERGYAGSRVLTGRCASAVVLHAEHDRQVLPAAIVRRSRVIPHGEYGGLGRSGAHHHVPAPELDPDADDPLVVLLFGQLRPDKGVADLVSAAAEVEGIHVWLVGEDKGALATIANLLEDPRLVGRVRVREGFLPIEEAPAVFAGADVVALPYRQASASGVLMLAYGYGRPVVAYPVGGLPEYVIEGETGWLCARPDAAALAQTLVAVRDAGRAVCAERGVLARRAADERYSWDAIARSTGDLYLDVMARGARREAIAQ